MNKMMDKETKEKKEKSLVSKLIMDFIAGVAVGAGAILPGFSGGVLCVVLGMYPMVMELFLILSKRLGVTFLIIF